MGSADGRWRAWDLFECARLARSPAFAVEAFTALGFPPSRVLCDMDRRVGTAETQRLVAQKPASSAKSAAGESRPMDGCYLT